MKIAVTGGIGSGKSFVCKLLEQRGIKVYDCDAGAKRLMRSSVKLRQDICRLVGDDAYAGGELQKKMLAKFITASGDNAQKVDDIVHPAVARDFAESGMDWLESAIYFDSGFYRLVEIDKVVCVTASLETRIQRVMARDGITREKTMEWIARQLPQEVVAARSDYRIVNDGEADLDGQIEDLLERLGM